MSVEMATIGNVGGHDLLPGFCAAVSEDLALLASLHAAELSKALVSNLHEKKFPLSLALVFEEKEMRSVVTMLYEEISRWPRDFPAAIAEELAADYAAIYLNNYCNASPQESFWLDDDHLAWQEPMFQVREIYANHDLEVTNWRIQADDHIVPELQFIAYLLGRSDAAEQLDDVAQFLDEHLLLWLGDFSRRVARRCDTPFYAGLALLTNNYCETLRDLLAAILDKPRLDRDAVLQRRKREKAEPVPVKFIPGAEASW